MLDVKRVKFVGFDLDHTLYPFTEEVNRVYRDTLYKELVRELGISYEKAEKEFNKNYKIVGSGTESVRIMGVKDPEGFSCVVSNKVDVHNYLEKDDQMIDLMRYLQESYTLFLITASAEASSKLKLKAIGLSPGDFRYRIYGDGKKAGKTQGRSFTQMLKLTKADPKDHLYVGDRDATDIIPAKKAGMQTVMAWGKSEEADLSIETVYELKNYL